MQLEDRSDTVDMGVPVSGNRGHFLVYSLYA